MAPLDERLISAAVELDHAAGHMVAAHRLLWPCDAALCEEALRLQDAVTALSARVGGEIAGEAKAVS